MPTIYRVNTDRKAIAALDPDDALAEDESSDLDSDEETEEPNHEPNDYKSHLWPQHPSLVARVLSNHNITPQDAFTAADMELQAVHYHPRRLILDLKSCVLEANFYLEPLLHSSPQIFTLAQWEGVSRVPREERGYKVAFAIEMTTHVLALLSHDNLWHLFWRSSTEFTRLQKHRVPGSGRYCTAEILALAGIPAWTSAFDVMTRPELYNRMLEGNTSDDFSLGASVQDQIEYSTHLRVHGKKEWHKKLRKMLHDFIRRLPCDLSPFQRLSLTPIPCLSLDEMNLLSLEFGNTNPVAQYFRDYQNKVLRNLTGAKRPPTMTPKLPFRIDRELLSLLPEPRHPCRLPTNLLRIKNQKRGKIWTVLETPWMEQQKRRSGSSWSKWKVKENEWKVKENTNQHRIATVANGVRGRFKGLCFWHQDMSDEQKLLMQKNWTSRSQYPDGMRKLDQASLGAEKKWKSSRSKTIRDTAPDISKRNMGIELRKGERRRGSS
ncbi:hypothetical protein B0H14DRAFT_2572985 [Mycena olivaceomarginata]|nr:hypothetical protein B0H14DRAFT_2572985 [Mycena olivaceomarginata]